MRGRWLRANKDWAKRLGLGSMMTSGAFYSCGADAGHMRSADIAKVAGLTIDVDFCDHPGLVAEWQGDSKTRKAALYDLTQDEVLALMVRLTFLEDAVTAAAANGLPAQPNRVLFTGHGCCLIYWTAEGEGWATDDGTGWTPSRMKATIKRWFDGEAHGYWWWDANAKDVGTRVFPLPGECHRERGHAGAYPAGKTVALLPDQHDDVTPLTPWFESLEAKYPVTVAKPKRRGPAPSKTRAPKAAGEPQEWTWVTRAWTPAWEASHGLDVDGRGACPVCDTLTGLRRMDKSRYVCFSCGTQMPIAMTYVPTTQTDEAVPAELAPGEVALDARGRALWPTTIPEHLLIKTRTGSGKTWLMAQQKELWLQKNAIGTLTVRTFVTDHRVIALSPYNSLAASLAERLDTVHATPESNLDWRSGSLSATFASLARVCAGMTPTTLANTMVVVDEVEQMLGQVYSMMKGEKPREALEVLSFVLAHAGRVILADAHAGDGTNTLIRYANDKRALAGLPPIVFAEWHSQPHVYDFHYVLPVEATSATGKTRTVSSADAQHKGLIADEVAAGKRVAVFAPSKRQAEALGAALVDRFPERSVRVITGQKGYEETHDFSEKSLTHDVLIYNSAMGTGVSFDVPEHYDTVHALLGNSGSTTAPVVEQAVHRIRHPRARHITISGAWSDLITDWRTDPSVVLDHARRSWERGTAASESWAGVTLSNDWMADSASQRLATVQAVLFAAAYRQGMRATLSCLALSHNFAPAGGADSDFASDVRAARDQAKSLEAAAIAKAIPLDTETLARIEQVGHANEDERIRYRATVIADTFGAAFTDGNDATRFTVAFDAEHRQLSQKARLMAAVRCLDTGLVEPLALAERRYNAQRTVMTAKTWQRDAAVLLDVLRILRAQPQAAGRFDITKEAARSACALVAARMKHAGRKMHDDWRGNPIKQVQAILGWAGLKLGVSRVKVQGVSTRAYWLAESAVERMVLMSDAFVTRWVEKAEAEKSTESSQAA